ncbi:serine/threonine-protein kinase [Streptomyces purpureus]|uniref:serine/threonine-protein kinase n=1 Tax=Streptomyces purpureus TaxID=1951 RepID=UPI0003A78BBB|nr:serine/threonine-protein kinase [Streptomyces purpureus]
MQPGEKFGPFTVLAELADGGMGRVHLARSPGGRLVAVKTLLTHGEDDRRRFAREVGLAQRVKGVYTASVVDADASGAVPWMATEYVPAPSLKELVERCGPLGPRALYWVAAGIAEALVSLHSAGLVHRDVKPSNVLLPLDGPRVIDFGISQAHDVTRTDTALGTVAYASPEQARGEPTTPASDVFSLGATLFHLAVGRAPYVGGGAGPAMEQLVRAATNDLDVTGLPDELGPLVLPCLAPDPADRPTPAALLAYCSRRLDRAADAREAWLSPSWTEAIERYRDERLRAVEEARRRVDPDAATGPVPAPGPTEPLGGGALSGSSGLSASTRPAGRGARRPWWPVAAGVAVAAAGIVLVVVRPWEGAATAAPGAPEQPLRIMEVESVRQGVCFPDRAGAQLPVGESPPPEGLSFTSDNRDTCVVAKGSGGMNVARFREVRVVEASASGTWEVQITFQDKDARAFAELTGRVAGQPEPRNQLAFVLGKDRLVSSIMVLERLPGGSAQITGGYTRNQAQALARALGAP